MKSKNKKVTVFLSSSANAASQYLRTAEAIGGFLARLGVCVVFGGTATGSMEALARGAKTGGGYVIGIIPKGMADKGKASDFCDELHVMEHLQDRKRKLLELGDIILALPGGPGTLDELGDALAEAICGDFKRPIVLFNAHGFYDDLLSFFKKMAGEGFLHFPLSEILSVTETLDQTERVLKKKLAGLN